MKIQIALTVDVDPYDWNHEYADNLTRPQIREQVKRDAEDAVVIAFAHLPSVTVSARP